MEILCGTGHLPRFNRGCVLSIGKFDGLHRGHIALLQALTKKARQSGVPSVVFTFDRSPVEILAPEKAPLPLCTLEQKIDLISAFAPDRLIIYPISRSFLERSAEEFLQTVVREKIGASAMVEGESFTFGAGRSGTPSFLKSWCQNSGIDLTILPPVTKFDSPVSSSRVRALLEAGEVGVARDMLMRPYRVTGIVADGEHRGRTLGFPTANLSEIKTILPKPGLYAARALVGAQFFPAAVNLGGNPTFGIEKFKTEVHILDWSGDLYGASLSIDFITRLRDIVPFSSKEELIEAMNSDLREIRSLWSTWIFADTIRS
ncbi:MAG: riboflavin biosynthesis protein RibF [Thermoguttaceae bacterium]|nr:riboflavin biosynthesis protein RibF [Thermoguttaceae bacterium]